MLLTLFIEALPIDATQQPLKGNVYEAQTGCKTKNNQVFLSVEAEKSIKTSV